MMRAQLSASFIIEMAIALSIALFSGWAMHLMLAGVPYTTAAMHAAAAYSANALGASAYMQGVHGAGVAR